MIKHIKIAMYIASCLCITNCSDRNASKISELQNTSEAPILEAMTISDEVTEKDICWHSDSIEKYIILKENDETLYADIRKIINAWGKFIILDASGSRTVVAFNENGNPITAYGKRGNGPGEYIYPWDVDADENFVYIMDTSQQKLLRYKHSGEYINSMNLPFTSRAFKLLDNGNILFQLYPDATKNNSQLCVTDSALTPIKLFLTYPKGQVLNLVTKYPFRINGATISFYSSPTDTIYTLDREGNLTGKRRLDFKQGTISKEAKLNYGEAYDKNLLRTGVFLQENPLETKSGIKYLRVFNCYGNKAKILTTGTNNKTSKVLTFGLNMSIFDIINPQTLTPNGDVISIINKDMQLNCSDYHLLPDSVKSALDEGNRVLAIHNIQ